MRQYSIEGDDKHGVKVRKTITVHEDRELTIEDLGFADEMLYFAWVQELGPGGGCVVREGHVVYDRTGNDAIPSQIAWL